MVTINDTPAKTSFSGNPMIYRVDSNNFYTRSGTKAWMWMSFDGIDTVTGHSFNLFYDGKDHVFTSVNYPGYSGFGIPTADPSWNHNQYAAAVHACLIANYDLRQHYTVELHEESEFSRVIHISAKEKGARWTIELKDVTVIHLTQSGRVVGEDRELQSNFGVIASLWDLESNLFGEDLKRVDSDGKVSFDVCDYFKAQFENRVASDPVPRFRFPDSGNDLFVEHPSFVLSYIGCFAERYDGTVKKYSFDQIRYCINGGLSRESLTYYNLLGSDYFSVSDNKFRFLASSPTEKVTGKFQGEKLYFYFAQDLLQFHYRLAVKVWFTDSTTESFYATDTFLTSEKIVLECLVGYARLNLGNVDPSKEVAKWDIWLEDHDGQSISEVRSFILDGVVREYERTFLFRNSFGCYELVRFIGEGEFTIENKRTSFTSQNFDSYSYFNAPNKTYEAWEIQKRLANSGWISKEQHDACRDLLLSTECYEILDDLLFPVVITSTRIKSFEKDGEYLFNIEVEYERAYNDQFYTVNFKPASMISTEDLTQGVGIIFEASEEVTYFGYPKFGTTSESDATWRIKKIEKTLVAGKPKYVVKWAGGDLSYDNIFANCESLVYAFLSS